MDLQQIISVWPHAAPAADIEMGMRIEEQNEHMISAKKGSAHVPRHIADRIIWQHMCIGADMDKLLSVADAITSDYQFAFNKIGVTGDPYWRAWLCSGHGSMQAHMRNGDPDAVTWCRMYNIGVNYGVSMAECEKKLIEHCSKKFGLMNDNVRQGGDGPIPHRGPIFLYVLVRIRSELYMY